MNLSIKQEELNKSLTKQLKHFIDNNFSKKERAVYTKCIKDLSISEHLLYLKAIKTKVSNESKSRHTVKKGSSR